MCSLMTSNNGVKTEANNGPLKCTHHEIKSPITPETNHYTLHHSIHMD